VELAATKPQIITENVKCFRKSTTNSIQIKAKLNGEDYNFIVDSGSSHTLVNCDLISPTCLQNSDSELLGITGHKSKLFGPIYVTIEIAGLVVDHPVYATKMSEQLILGLDFMMKYHCNICLSNMTMTIGNDIVKLQLQQVDSDDKTNYSSTVVKSTTMTKPVTVNDHNEHMQDLPCQVQDDRSMVKLPNQVTELKMNPKGQLVTSRIAKLDQYNYGIQHRADFDSLSRRPCAEECNCCSKREEKSDTSRYKCLQASTKINSASDLKEYKIQCLQASTKINKSASDLVEHKIKFKEAQKEDKDLKPIIMKMEESSLRPAWEQISGTSATTKCYWAQWDMLRIQDNILQHKWVNNDGTIQYWQTVVPRSIRSRILEENHNNVTSGHLGVRKTLSKLRQRFYWIGMRHDVEEWCRTCDTCCSKKGPQKRVRAPLKLYQVGAPMKRVTVDITSPLSNTTFKKTIFI